MNIDFLKKSFAEIPQKTSEIAASNINTYRDFIGNGVAVGKLAEVIIAKMFCNEKSMIHGFSFTFTGKNPPFDIMIYKRNKALDKKVFTDFRRLYEQDFTAFSNAISESIGSDQWCGISLKNYLNEESQLTTNYNIRSICEKELGDEERTYTDKDLIKKLVIKIKESLSHEIILLMNSFPKTKKYQFRLFSLDDIEITTIEFSQKRKHSRFIFGNKTGAVFHVKYGKGQANPFQRGIWIDDLEQLPLLREGVYNESGFAKYILNGALEEHP